MGGLWLAANIKASNKERPRWTGSYTCSGYGRKDRIIGFGLDQQKSQSGSASTIQLKFKRDA
jgi:hypothetical protein